MTEWHPSKRDLKRYPHFDKFLPPTEIEAIVKDPKRVRSNAFFPFIQYIKSWQPFRSGNAPRKKKERPIRYASRRDACIFAYYRHVLSERYEALLSDLKISNCVIAYRKIPVGGDGGRGKCNIHFAKDAFDSVITLGDCCAVALDISSYFENIDHERLKHVWCRLLQVDELPPDHAHVFRNITRYAVVDRDEVYERLGYFGFTSDGSKGYLRPFNEMPMQLCTPKEFRDKVCGGLPTFPSLIEVNENSYGIPQGAPISDLLANAYLIDFDAKVAAFVCKRGGFYFRYSDDILMIVPGDEEEGQAAKNYAMELIEQFGDHLIIKSSKSSVVAFNQEAEGQSFRLVEGTQGKNGLEYLGFRFDGKNVYLRDSTLSAFYRKITYSARRSADAFVARYPGKDISFLVQNFDVEKFARKFGRVEDFEDNQDYHTWTFWTYARRAANVFGQQGRPIFRQLRDHRRIIRERIESELARALIRKKKQQDADGA